MDLYLHAVIIRKPITLPLARKKAQEWIRNSYRRFVREDEDAYYFRNIPAKNFESIQKIEQDGVGLLVGRLKDNNTVFADSKSANIVDDGQTGFISGGVSVS
jgi:hypothetical protein